MTGEEYDEQFKREVLPDWAERYDPSGSIEPGRQLCTKDGRRCGNAFVIQQGKGIPALVFIPTWEVLTDAGNKLVCTTDEIHELFYIGDYISKSYSIPGLRNQNYEESLT